jgi:hypothetical protein
MLDCYWIGGGVMGGEVRTFDTRKGLHIFITKIIPLHNQMSVNVNEIIITNTRIYLT